MSNLTESAIKNSFLKLLNERPLSKITVKDIVEDCGINRNSFYYHFRDLPALIEEIVISEIRRCIKENPEISSFEDCLKVAAEFALNNRKAVYHIYKSVSRDIFENYLWQMCHYVVETYIKTTYSDYNVSDNDMKIIMQYYKCELFGQIIGWLADDMREDIIENNHRLCEIRKGFGEEMFSRCSASHKCE